MIPQRAFRQLQQPGHGICILNWQLKTKYQNENAREIFTEHPELFQQLTKICEFFSVEPKDAGNPLISHTGTLHYLSAMVSFSCLRIGEEEKTCFFIIFDYISLLDDELSANIVLTPREQEIVHIMAMGKTNKEISKILCIGLETVKSHIRNLFAKTGTSSRVELIAKLQHIRNAGML